MKNIVGTFISLFLLVSCSSTNNNQEVANKEALKLGRTISIINNHYLGDIKNSDLKNINKKYSTKEEAKTDIKLLLKKLDKYSVYINNSDKKNVKKITFEKINHDILYIMLPYFHKNTSKKLSYIIKNNNSKALILDLRNNPGGLFKEAIKTANLFVDKGDIISIKEKRTNGIRTYRASVKQTITNIPLVVLINKNTASSAEILSGALKDLKRAKLIGENSFGKNTIQALIYINKKEAIKFTIAKYYFPNKKHLNNKIKPNIVVLDNQKNYAIKYLNSFKK